ncbi:MAG: hypothetical protein ABI988_19550, partial [Nitrospirota bacterium]
MKSGSEQTSAILPTSSLQRLIDLLQAKGHRVVAPTLRDGAVVWDAIRQSADLPVGWRDVQKPGRYRLENTGSTQVFGIVHGPQSLKPFTFAPREPLLQIERTKKRFSARTTLPQHQNIAILAACRSSHQFCLHPCIVG